MTNGDGMQRLRRAKGLSRERLAAIVGLTAQTIYLAERRGGPTLRTALLVAPILGCRVEDLHPHDAIVTTHKDGRFSIVPARKGKAIAAPSVEANGNAR